MNVQEAAQGTMRLLVARDYDELSRHGVHVLVETLHRRPNAVVSLTTGRTTAGLYRALRELCRAARVDLAAARLVSSEEYVGVGADDAISLFGWLRRELLAPCGVPAGSMLCLAGDAANLEGECRRFDAQIEQLGGIDLAVQSVGANGHFGFNEPGSSRDAPSRVVSLAPSTLATNADYWRDGTQVPGQGLTMGIPTILRARHVLLLASGPAKAPALARALDGPIDEAAPCSLLHLAPRLTVIADEAAAAMLALSPGVMHVESATTDR